MCPGRSALQYLRLTLGPELVIRGHITLDGNNQIICVGDVGLLSVATRLHNELTEGLNIPRVVIA